MAETYIALNFHLAEWGRALAAKETESQMGILTYRDIFPEFFLQDSHSNYECFVTSLPLLTLNDSIDLITLL